MLTVRSFAFLVAFTCLAVLPARAQLADTLAQEDVAQSTILGVPLHEVIVGGGLAIYQGELDRNPYRSLSGYLLNGGMDITLGIERTFDASFAQFNFRYTYVKGGDQYVEGHSRCCGFSNSTLGGNILSGFKISIGNRLDMLRVFTGLGLMRHLPMVKNPDLLEEYMDVEMLDEREGLWSFSVPVGITIMRTVRLTGRLVMSDYLDGAASDRPYDYLIHINVIRPFSIGS